MKQCPTCSRTYSDDTLVFCLDDGTALINRANLQETLRLDAPRRTPPVIPSPGQTYQSASRPTRWPIYVLLALVALGLILGVVAIAAFGYWKMSASPSTTKVEQPDNDKGESWLSPTPAVSPTPRTAQALVGTWRTSDVENGLPTEVTVTFLPDGNTRYAFKQRGKTATDTATWQYSDGMLFERYSTGTTGKVSIRWIDDNHFEATIIDNGVPAYSGRKRDYHRI